MKKVFIFALLATFAFVVIAQRSGNRDRGRDTSNEMAQTSQSADTVARPVAEAKTCADWVAEGECPRATEQGSCADFKAAGRCPKVKTCATWRAEGKCPKPEDRRRCSEIQADGKCPKMIVRAAEAKAEPQQCARTGEACARSQTGSCTNRTTGVR